MSIALCFIMPMVIFVVIVAFWGGLAPPRNSRKDDYDPTLFP